MDTKPSIPDKLQGQIAERVQYLRSCEHFLETATQDLIRSPDNPYLQRRVRILMAMIASTQHIIQSLERMLKQLQ